MSWYKPAMVSGKTQRLTKRGVGRSVFFDSLFDICICKTHGIPGNAEVLQMQRLQMSPPQRPLKPKS